VPLTIVNGGDKAGFSTALTSIFGFYLVVLWPSIAILVKRMHDSNKPGWLVLLLYAP
jgi:uncharacterized membrane protein YhaH (DUF805 family)